MSVLSREREIDAQTLTQFIPRDEESTQLATIQKDGKDDHSYASERSQGVKLSETPAREMVKGYFAGFQY